MTRLKLADDYSNIGIALNELENNNKALEYYQKTLSTLETLNKLIKANELMSLVKERISELRNIK